MVENNQSEATMYQYFTIVNDDKFPEDNMDEEATIVNSVDNVDENDQEVMYLVQPVSSDVVLNSTVCEDLQGDDEPEFEYDPLVCPQIEFILEDGQMYLNSNTLKDVDETYTLDADLINTTDSIIEDTEGNIHAEKAINKTASDLEESETNFWKVQLADGTCAFINNSVWASLKQKEEKQKVVIPKQEKKIICSYFGCNKVYSSIHHLAVHMRNHTGSRPYQCPFANCEKAFAAGSSLKAHLRTHTGEAPYGCMMCPKHFKTSGDLQKHVRTHTGEKPFKCPIEGCGRSFTTTNIRKVHIRSHTGERPFRCTHQDCNKAFASATNFKNHMRIHSGEKPYQCGVEGCGKRFTEYSSLFKHNAVHKHHQYKTCEYCGQQYKYETTLRTHVQLMHTIVVNDDGSQVQVKKKSHRHKVRILK